jgi:hypothetical protein
MSFEIDVEIAVRRLTLLEQAVLKARFGIPVTNERAARNARLPRSAAQIRQIERRALRKLRLDGTVLSHAKVSSIAPGLPAGTDLQSGELLNMAVFRLRECAQRILRLAQATPSPGLAAMFLAVYQELMQQEKQLQAVTHAVSAGQAESRTASAVA